MNPKNLQNLKKDLGTGRANSSGSEEVKKVSSGLLTEQHMLSGLADDTVNIPK
jgi:hypothetical protein